MSGRRPQPAADVGGFAVVARALNEKLDWHGKMITRQQVQAWHKRSTLNRQGYPPPRPARTYDKQAYSTASSVEFNVRQWVDWAAAGVPGTHGQGWVVPELVPGRRTAVPA